MIQFQNVSVTIQGNKILDNINLTVNDGEFVLLCRESGCGKTTLTRLVNGLIPHFVKGVKVDGAVTVEALDIAESPMYKIAESVGSVFQHRFLCRDCLWAGEYRRRPGFHAQKSSENHIRSGN